LRSNDALDLEGNAQILWAWKPVADNRGLKSHDRGPIEESLGNLVAIGKKTRFLIRQIHVMTLTPRLRLNEYRCARAAVAE
jgi:hypothetical protein